jgi:hypothetical protein
MDKLTNNTVSGDWQVSAIQKHLRAVSAILTNRAHDSITLSHSRRLRRLASLVSAATPGIVRCVALATPQKPLKSPKCQLLAMCEKSEGPEVRV